MLNLFKRKIQVIKTPLLSECKSDYRVIQDGNGEFRVQYYTGPFPVTMRWCTSRRNSFSELEDAIKHALALWEVDKKLKRADTITTIYEGE